MIDIIFMKIRQISKFIVQALDLMVEAEQV
jgi:hypothetical protein